MYSLLCLIDERSENVCCFFPEKCMINSSEEDTNSNSLTHFWPMFSFYTPIKHQKIKGFLVFSGGINCEHRSEMGYVMLYVKYCVVV